MKKTIIFLTIVLLLLPNVNFVLAHGSEEFAQAEKIIEQKVSCNDLTNNQLEILGDYYMEQMHPGEMHEQMDVMMGGEGSEPLKSMHIQMGQMFYCGRQAQMSKMMETMDMKMMDEMHNDGMMETTTSMGMGGGMMGGMMNGLSGMNGGLNSLLKSSSGNHGFFGWTFMVLLITGSGLLIVFLVKEMHVYNQRDERRMKRK